LNLPKAVRKDAVVMVGMLISSGHEYFENISLKQQTQFFEDSYKFFCNRYGKENVISSTVHLDEHTPHMHFNFIPVTSDGRLSAKSILTRQELRSLQSDFYQEVGIRYGLERGKDGSTATHLSEMEYKLKKTSEKALEASKALQRVESLVEDEKSKYEAFRAYSEGVMSNVSSEAIPGRKKTSIFGNDTMELSIDEYDELQRSVTSLTRPLSGHQ